MTTHAQHTSGHQAKHKANHCAVDDGGSASSKTIPCYTIDQFKRELDVASGNRVQLNMRIDKWLRDRFNKLAKKYGASTCEIQ